MNYPANNYQIVKNSNAFLGPSFSLKNRIARVVWEVVALLFFRYSPKPLFAWRAFILRIFGAKVEHGVHIYPKVEIWAPWNLELCKECGIANGVSLYNQDKIFIGVRTVVSQGAHLVTGTHDYTKPGFPLITMPIRIGEHVWIAADAFIHPGVVVGKGCVIGARSVVTKDMPEWMVCSGHPCIPIKARKMINVP